MRKPGGGWRKLLALAAKTLSRYNHLGLLETSPALAGRISKRL